MRYLDFERPVEELDRLIQQQKDYQQKTGLNMTGEIEALERKRHQLIRDIFYNLTPYQRIQLARHPERPYCLDYIRLMTTDFVELHGDRAFGDDPAMVGGFANLDGRTVMIIGHQKGRDTEENLRRNFGMANPEGFRKALRLMQMAERFHKPVICFIDSAGAYPGVGAEERGQAEAIARNLMVISQLKTPIVVVVTGEGGSGGALAIAVGDRILILQNAYYAVCTPEACAAILFKDRAKASTAVSSMKITPEDLLELGVIDEIIPEPLGGAHQNWQEAADALKQATHSEQSICFLPSTRSTDRAALCQIQGHG
ncbi:MAG: Acetyl-coenzyme A carboxylase carboxyl transferase subunit alpha [Candidatus Hinthialibacteria bacterium OLB16]|nr:MAG: Acetyl-coenzyme A carboxylase carboxyl transferase subunit alpha [Candidatus Hinthialibacteria bacterium OLB16]